MIKRSVLVTTETIYQPFRNPIMHYAMDQEKKFSIVTRFRCIKFSLVMVTILAKSFKNSMTSSSMEIQWDIVLDLSYSGDSGGKTLSKIIDIWRKEPTPK